MLARTWIPNFICLVAAVSMLAALTACGGGNNNNDGAGGGAGGGGGAGAHPDIALRDESGGLIMAGSTAPYSPRATCGACHDVDQISSGYHFQQGRIDINGAVHTNDDFFQDGRDFVRSDGMYGKW